VPDTDVSGRAARTLEKHLRFRSRFVERLAYFETATGLMHDPHSTAVSPGQLLSSDSFVQNWSTSGMVSEHEARETLAEAPEPVRRDPELFVRYLIETGRLTAYQAERIRDRKFQELLIGNYEVLDRLGAGGMGTVFKARHRRMKRLVAIKVLSAEVAKSQEFVHRFQREVEAVARLSHPNIVMAFDADEDNVGHFLVMEYVDGRDLQTDVEKQGAIAPRPAVDYIVQAARALDYAHAQGIIHRDIKPANLLRDSKGVIKVADLGLARFNDPLGRQGDGASAITQAGTIMGTVDFMPPEQAEGLKTTDRRADIYSLGCTLYYLLTGLPPYRGQTLMATLLQHRDAPIPSLAAAGLPPQIDPVFQRMVAKHPEARYQSMADVISALEGLAFASEGLSPPTTGELTPTASTIALAPTRVAPPPTSAPTRSHDPAERSAVAGEPPLTASVLLVEPSRTQLVIIRTYLQELGTQRIQAAASGEKALELARADRPQCLISAMHLTDMTGIELSRRVRADSALANTGFVLITSADDAQGSAILRQVDHVVLLQKPFDKTGLAQALREGSAHRSPPATTPAPHLRVLVVDDSATARAHIRKVLGEYGLNDCTEAANGAEAVALIEERPFALVVTDYNMPRLDGRGLIEFIRQRSAARDVPVVLCTTVTEPAQLAAVRRLGVSAVCDKSFRPETVRAVIERLLSRRM
jgi:serine/threonine protein kinase/DNA-binding response OmpR family regulator